MAIEKLSTEQYAKRLNTSRQCVLYRIDNAKSLPAVISWERIAGRYILMVDTDKCNAVAKIKTWKKIVKRQKELSLI